MLRILLATQISHLNTVQYFQPCRKPQRSDDEKIGGAWCKGMEITEDEITRVTHRQIQMWSIESRSRSGSGSDRPVVENGSRLSDSALGGADQGNLELISSGCLPRSSETP